MRIHENLESCMSRNIIEEPRKTQVIYIQGLCVREIKSGFNTEKILFQKAHLCPASLESLDLRPRRRVFSSEAGDLRHELSNAGLRWSSHWPIRGQICVTVRWSLASDWSSYLTSLTCWATARSPRTPQSPPASVSPHPAPCACWGNSQPSLASSQPKIVNVELIVDA